jgi:O-antigen ligase
MRAGAIAAVAVVAVVAGAAGVKQPEMVLGLVAAAGLTTLVFRAPAIAVSGLLLLTAVVPYGIQNQLGIGGGEGSPGLLLSDVLLFAGLAWAFLALAEQRVARREFAIAIGALVLVAVVILQFIHGVRAGHELGRAGQDLRVLLSIALCVIVFPLLSEERMRRQFEIGLLLCALALGLWGVAQWFGHIQLGAAADVGVRTGVRLTTAGKGQLQGGEYGFPVAIIMCSAVLAAGAVRSRAIRALLWAALGLNAVSCVVTFERTFWLSTMVGIALALARTPPQRRVAALCATPFVLLATVAGLATFAPAELQTAKERLLSLGDYAQDDSVRYRVVESRHVSDQIKAHPLAGSGLAATIFWSQPWAQLPAETTAFSHNGYLWLAWRLGLPGAALLLLMLGFAIAARAPPACDPVLRAMRAGAQGALAALLLVMLTFPVVSALSITAVVGVLLGLAVATPSEARKSAASSDVGSVCLVHA